MTTQLSQFQSSIDSLDKSKLPAEQVRGLELIETRRRIHELKLMIIHKSEKNMEITVKLIQRWLQADEEASKA